MLKKNEKLTLLDNPQILRHTFDEENDAQRVVIVGGSDIAKEIREGLKNIKIEVTPNWPKANFIVPEPKIIQHTEFREIEKPSVTPQQIEVRYIEVPAIPRSLLWLLGIQILISLVTLLIK